MVVNHLSMHIITYKREMSIRMKKNYYLGFDIGTDSIGWAVTDMEYNLLKARGHDYWGTYLFDEAETAQARRAFRTARRRTARKRQRIKLLQELFSKEIAKVDFCFFERLNNSKYNVEDKSGNVKYRDSLFHDTIFNDKDYFKKYPTIYHLRRAFLDKDRAFEIKDARLLYLAVAHIIKNRGHFLFEGQEINAADKELAKRAFENINSILLDIDENAQTLSLEKIGDVFVVLCEKKKTKRDKEKELRQLLDVKTDKTCQEIVKSFVGSKVKVQNLFGEGEYEQKDFCFDDANFELDKLQSVFSEEEYALICEMKAVYDWAILAQILGDYKYISQAMCAKYDQHKQDLQTLKAYIMDKYGKETYAEVFRKKDKINNYAAYIGSDRNKSFAHASKDDFYKFLLPLVKENDAITEAIEEGTFLDKQRTNANGVIPYQVHKAELELILENASVNFPFLNEISDGITIKEKIVMLLTFRVPYFVGPLNDLHSGTKFAWVKKYEGTNGLKITPWNFDKIVDKQASEDAFIDRMTNKCTYLIGEDVLPKQSLLYSEYSFRNELNNVTFKGQRLDKIARETIVEFAKSNKTKITPSQIGKILEKAGLIEKGEGVKENFAGIDGHIKSSFAMHMFFKSLFGENYDKATCENIIKWFTIMGDAKRAAERAQREYKLDDETTKKLSSLNCSGWGRLSKTFLDSDDITTLTADGEVLTVIEAMRETGCNLMELLSQKYGFSAAVDKFNEQNAESSNVTYKTIENLYCSPSVKRAIWRTVCLAREVEKVQGNAPARIFVEMARGEDKEKKRTKPRKQQLLDLYQACKSDVYEWVSQKEIEDLTEEIRQTSDVKFMSDKIYLYYMQMGRCAYTGKPIGIEDLWSKNTCDIDHIYPQSKIKDDSIINNKVLCYKEENATKQDVYPIDSNVRKKMMPIWSTWHKHGLISDEKFKRLTRCTPLTQEELSDFINRQLVETRQSTKAVAQILKRIYPDTDIVYSKAGNVNEFKKYVNQNSKAPRIVKVRELNDLHHAKDAYLNIVVGNVYYTKFNRNAAVYFKNHSLDSYNMTKIFESEVGNAWAPSMKDYVVSVVNKNTCRVVRFTSEGSGGLFNATIKTKGANDKLIPLKRNCPLEDISKYGGYDNATTAYFSLVESVDKKGKKIISLEAIPIYIDLLGKEKIYDYLVGVIELKQPRVLIEKIKLNSLLKLNGAYVWLRGKTGDRVVLCNANELVLDLEETAYVKRITSFIAKQKKTRELLIPTEEFDGITKSKNLTLYKAFIEKMSGAPYSKLPSIPQQASFLASKIDEFNCLDTREQVLVLLEILHFAQCNSVQSNISLLGGAPHAGVLLHSKKLSADEECLLITQSPTGYYKNVIDLVSFYNK